MGVGSSDDLSVPQYPSGDMDWVDDGWISRGQDPGDVWTVRQTMMTYKVDF